MSRGRIIKAGSWSTGLGIILILLLLAPGGPAHADDYYVTTLADECDTMIVLGGLRRAINRANGHSGPDNIRFDGLSGTITLDCELPALTDYGTVIMGETAATGVGGIIIDGDSSVAVGFHMAGQSCVVRGLKIRNFSDCGILIEPLPGGLARNNLVGGAVEDHKNTIRKNDVGIRLAGSPCDSNVLYNNRVNNNGADGICLIDGPSSNTIGGEATNKPNVVKLNSRHGIYLEGDVQDNLISGNRVGTNVDGTLAHGNGADGIRLEGSDCSNNDVKGNQVCDNGACGIVVSGGDGNHVFSNNVGLNSARADSIPNNSSGILLNNTANCEVDENTVSGNRGNGVEITGVSRDNTVSDNYIGTNSYWDRLGNRGEGLIIHTCGAGTENNLISGNTIADNSTGILIAETCDNIRVYGNGIGTDPSGSENIGNGCEGVIINSTGNLVGGPEEGQPNHISYNNLDGVWLYNSLSAQGQNRIQGNTIMYNGWNGISIDEGMVNNTVGCSSMGGPAAAGNTIISNSLHGISCGYSLAAIPPSENCFMSNSIHGNGLLGIDLLSTVPPGNDGIPAPTITSATPVGASGVTNLGGNDSMVQLFTNGTGDEGLALVAEFLVTGTDNWSYSGPLPDGENLTATNTGCWPAPSSAWQTSEFSPPVMIDCAGVREEREASLPSVFRMAAISPNPFGGSTRVMFDIPRATSVSLKVYDATGRPVRSLVDGSMVPGRYGVNWDACDDHGRMVAPGVYFCRFEHTDGCEVRELIYLR
jgi:parallel beta-helix repeat protein